MRKILPEKFFDRRATAVAADLLGKWLVCRHGKREVSAMITDVEAYDGPRDRASHASRGRTERNAPMFGAAGHWYVYFVYGMHWMCNIVTGRVGYPAAVLLRGVAGTSGPARVAKRFGIDRKFNGVAALRRNGLCIEDRGDSIRRKDVVRGPRIGVDYAGEWAKRPYRFRFKPPQPHHAVADK